MGEETLYCASKTLLRASTLHGAEALNPTNPNPNPNPYLGEVLPREGGGPGGDGRRHTGPLHGAERRVLGAVGAIGLKVIRLTILLTQRGDRPAGRQHVRLDAPVPGGPARGELEAGGARG
eukprot:1195376-Prorocentrum_minimum.AAC.2